MRELTADIAGVIGKLDVGPVTVVGHDWGGAVAWRLALDYPDQVSSVISLGTLLLPRSDNEPIATRRAMMGDDNYVVFVQTPEATRILEADVAETIDFMFREGHMTTEAYATAPATIKNFELIKEMQTGAWKSDFETALSAQERASQIAAFTRTGFDPGLNWYRNATRNWKDAANLTTVVQQPSLLISGKDDYFSPARFAAMMDPVVPKLDKVVVEGGHWFPLENPQQTNEQIVAWLTKTAK